MPSPEKRSYRNVAQPLPEVKKPVTDEMAYRELSDFRLAMLSFHLTDTGAVFRVASCEGELQRPFGPVIRAPYDNRKLKSLKTGCLNLNVINPRFQPLTGELAILASLQGDEFRSPPLELSRLRSQSGFPPRQGWFRRRSELA
jgi:hypothetical protein